MDDQESHVLQNIAVVTVGAHIKTTYFTTEMHIHFSSLLWGMFFTAYYSFIFLQFYFSL